MRLRHGGFLKIKELSYPCLQTSSPAEPGPTTTASLTFLSHLPSYSLIISSHVKSVWSSIFKDSLKKFKTWSMSTLTAHQACFMCSDRAWSHDATTSNWSSISTTKQVLNSETDSTEDRYEFVDPKINCLLYPLTTKILSVCAKTEEFRSRDDSFTTGHTEDG